MHLHLERTARAPHRVHARRIGCSVADDASKHRTGWDAQHKEGVPAGTGMDCSELP